MKIRTDFVTNSSSSSYICESCGRVSSGWDYGLSDAEMCECENGHTICLDEMKELTFDIKKAYLIRALERDIKYNKAQLEKEPDRFYYHDRIETTEKELEKIKNITEEQVDDDYDLEEFIDELADEYELDYNYPSELCPVCNHDVVTEYELINYACSQLDISRKDLENAAREYLIAEDEKKKNS